MRSAGSVERRNDTPLAVSQAELFRNKQKTSICGAFAQQILVLNFMFALNYIMFSAIAISIEFWWQKFQYRLRIGLDTHPRSGLNTFDPKDTESASACPCAKRRRHKIYASNTSSKSVLATLATPSILNFTAPVGSFQRTSLMLLPSTNLEPIETASR